MEILKNALMVIGGLTVICIVGFVGFIAGVILWFRFKKFPNEEEPRHHDWQYKHARGG